ncbi:MAG: GMC family oxidoreductase [Smithella sp.]
MERTNETGLARGWMHQVGLALTESVFYDSRGMPLDHAAILSNWKTLVANAPIAKSVLPLLMGFFNMMTLPVHGKTFVQLKPAERYEFLKGLTDSKYYMPRMLGNILGLSLKFAYACSPEVHASLGIPYRKDKICAEPEPRWMRQINPAHTFAGDDNIEADVVVVGTGAGGAVVAKELAEKGYAVAIIEAGSFHRRHEFTGNPLDMIPLLYRNRAFTATLGNAIIPIQMGRAVGGTTLINSATCFRTPDDILQSWVAMGLSDFTPEKIAPYFERVEEIVRVQECESRYIGPIGEVIREGCERLGYSCGPLKHNTVDCDGQGVCTQGCSKDAKQSTNISYIPRALNAAAQLFTGFEVREILSRGERVIGVRASGVDRNGQAVYLTCHARAVILAAGAFGSPALIRKNKLVRGNRWVSRNLTIHPAVFVGALFPDRDMKNHTSIPQGYMIDEFVREGLRFEGGMPPFMIFASMLPGMGREYTEWVANYHHLAIFGGMVKDTGTGFVRPGPGGIPLMFYNLARADTQNLVRAMQILGRVYFAAGAQKIFLPTFEHPVLENQAELEHITTRRWKARDMLLSAFHALGTARIGLSDADSAANSDHQMHRVPGLFVVDGSSIPTGLGVNPQETIMAVATRAAERIGRILDKTRSDISPQ